MIVGGGYYDTSYYTIVTYYYGFYKFLNAYDLQQNKPQHNVQF